MKYYLSAFNECEPWYVTVEMCLPFFRKFIDYSRWSASTYISKVNTTKSTTKISIHLFTQPFSGVYPGLGWGGSKKDSLLIWFTFTALCNCMKKIKIFLFSWLYLIFLTKCKLTKLVILAQLRCVEFGGVFVNSC